MLVQDLEISLGDGLINPMHSSNRPDEDSYQVEFTYEECTELHIALSERLRKIRHEIATGSFSIPLIRTYKRAVEVLETCDSKLRRCLN
jgi:hypothetical protein